MLFQIVVLIHEFFFVLCNEPEEPIIFINALLILSNKHPAYNLAQLRIRCAFLCDIRGQQREFHICFSMMVNHQSWLTEIRFTCVQLSSGSRTIRLCCQTTHDGSQIMSLHQTLTVAPQTLISGQRHAESIVHGKWLVWPAGGRMRRLSQTRPSWSGLPPLLCHPRGNQSCQSAEIGLLRFRFCERKNDSETSCLSCRCMGVVWISGSD